MDLGPSANISQTGTDTDTALASNLTGTLRVIRVGRSNDLCTNGAHYGVVSLMDRNLYLVLKSASQNVVLGIATLLELVSAEKSTDARVFHVSL